MTPFDRAEAEARVWERARMVIAEDAIDGWLHRPNPMLDGETPFALMVSGPDGRDRVIGLIDSIGEGVFA